jgi:hypothetical protein
MNEIIVKPLESYQPPNLPTLEESRKNPDFLKKLPLRWRKKAAVIAAAVLLVCIMLTACGTEPMSADDNYKLDISEDEIPEFDTEDEFEIPEEPFENILEEKNIIQFGFYNWRVLDVQDSKALIISETLVNFKQYYTVEYYAEIEGLTWEDSDIRHYLNNEFYNSFNEDDKARITDTIVINSGDPRLGTEGGNNTIDKIFLLSIDEVKMYFSDDEDRVMRATALEDGELYELRWWLRSPGKYGTSCVDEYGRIDDWWGFYDDFLSVRPALWLNIES